jgi:hypothetical protein
MAKQIEAIGSELHPQAAKLVKEYTNEFATSLLLQAKALAYQRKDDMVLGNHVVEAWRFITQERKQTWSRELVIIVGAALFGAFIQGFISALSSGNALLIATYTVLGFIGMFLVFWGLRR